MLAKEQVCVFVFACAYVFVCACVCGCECVCLCVRLYECLRECLQMPITHSPELLSLQYSASSGLRTNFITRLLQHLLSLPQPLAFKFAAHVYLPFIWYAKRRAAHH